MVIELIATATRLLSQIEQRKQFKDRLTPVFPNNTGDQQMKMEEHTLLGMKQLHRSVESLNDVFKSLAQHVADQDILVDSIESQIKGTSENTNEGCQQQLIEAKSSQNGKRWLIAKFILVATFIVGVGLLLL
jgi:t-SNARE complex subunit (syntaxin)